MITKTVAVGIAVFLCAHLILVSAPAQEPPPIFGPGDHTKITLDIKGMDVVDVMKMLATRTGLSIVIGKNVVGKVTLFLKDVDIADAFEIIVLSNDLAYDRQGKIINIMTQRDYEQQYGQRYQDRKRIETIKLKFAKAPDLSRALNQMKSNIGRVVVDDASNTLVLIDTADTILAMSDFIQKADLPVETKIFSLNYAQAEKVSPKIQDALTKGVGSLKADERTNKIAVTDFPDKLAEIDRIIQAFDERPKQVLIDAQVIEVRPSDNFEMGVDWNYWLQKNFQVAAQLPIGTGNRLIIGTPPGVTPTEPRGYSGILDLLRTIGDTKILSSPRIMVVNNQEARILVGTKDAYITSSTTQSGDTAVTSQTVNFVDVGIKLYVTPTISTEGFVTMKIRPEISSAERVDLVSEGKTTQVPIVTTSESETTVVVKDGVTIIIGGLQKEERDKTVKKIPLLGDVPGVGFFFRSTSVAVSKNELVILLTPHIMSGETPFTDFAQMRPQQGAVAKMINGKIITEKTVEAPAGGCASAYYQLIMDKARRAALIQRPAGQKGILKIAFTLSRGGSLIGEPRIMQGDNGTLSAFATRAIRNAVPFPPLPACLNKAEETFKIDLAYE